VLTVGVVSVSGRMDYENVTDPKQITSLLTVFEPDATNRTVNATLLLIVNDVNDNSPVFTEDVRNHSRSF